MRMRPVSFSTHSPKFGSVFPIEVRLKNPDEQLPNGLRRNPELSHPLESPWLRTWPGFQAVASMMLLFLTGEQHNGRPQVSDSVQKRFQMNLAELDPEYRPGAPIKETNNYEQWDAHLRRADLNGEDLEDKNRGGTLWVTGAQDCDTLERLEGHYYTALAESCWQEQVKAKDVLKQWLKARIQASGQKSIILNGVLPPGSSDPQDVQLLDIKSE